MPQAAIMRESGLMMRLLQGQQSKRETPLILEDISGAMIVSCAYSMPYSRLQFCAVKYILSLKKKK